MWYLKVDGIRYQNKAGNIDLKNGTITWSGHRTTKHKTIEEKISFISENHCDKYVNVGKKFKRMGERYKKVLSFNI